GWNHGHRVHGAALVARVSKNGVMGTAGAEAWRVHHGMACRHVRMLIVPRNQTGKLSKDKDREEPRAKVSDPANPAHVEWSSDRSHDRQSGQVHGGGTTHGPSMPSSFCYVLTFGLRAASRDNSYRPADQRAGARSRALRSCIP